LVRNTTHPLSSPENSQCKRPGLVKASFCYELQAGGFRGEKRVLGRRLLPALLLVAPPTVALWASTGVVQAMEECRLEPGWPAPPGSKWVSRINRDHYRCWFLSTGAGADHHTQLRRAAAAKNDHRAGHAEAARRHKQRDSDPQTGSAPTDKTDSVVATEPPAVSQVAAPPVEQSSEDLVPHGVPTVAYRWLPPNAQAASEPTAVTVQAVEPTPADTSKSNVVLLASAATTAGLLLLFAGGIFHFTGGHLRSRKRAVTLRHCVRGLASSVAAKSPPMTTDWAEDLGRLEVKRDRLGAPELRNLPVSRQRDAVSLPQAAAWLNRHLADA
jgi:hypothetical protein